jgi:DNA polymerase-4
VTSPRSIIHLDMDAFYASVEQRDHPELQGKPVIVGGHPTRGVVLAASYEVRPFGVRSAMPMSRALKAAPHAIVMPPRFHAYSEASEQVFGILSSVTPLIEPLSLDEAFLDVTASRALFGDAESIGTKLRARIRDEVHLPCSTGIAESKFLAKIASDLAKPNGQKVVPPGTAKEFLAPLPISRLWGVGPKTEEVLVRLGLETIGDVATKELFWLEKRLGSLGPHLYGLANGIDDRAVIPDHEQKSLGSQDTFEEDLLGVEALKPHLHSQALRVGRRLRKAGLKGRVVQLTLKYFDFSHLTRRHTLDAPTDDGQVLYREACALLEKCDLSKRVRLTGVTAADFEHEVPQLGLFDEAPKPKRADKLNQALDQIASKFGTKAVTTADLKGDVEDEREELLRRQVGAARADGRKTKPTR